jgi:hypothetical protein
MKIVGMVIHWYIGWANAPEIYITVAKKHPEHEYIPIPYKRGTYYYSIADGIIDGLYHDPQDEHGFSNRVFDLKVVGKTVRVKGPWDVGSATFNKLTGMQAISIAYAWRGDPLSIYYGTMALLEPIQNYLFSQNSSLELRPRPTQTTGVSDAQSEIVLWGQNIKPDTFVYELAKDLRYQVGCFNLGDKRHSEDCFTVFGEPKPDLYFRYEGKTFVQF